MTSPQQPDSTEAPRSFVATPPNPEEVNAFHRYDDIDGSPDAHHHSLGPENNQASPGGHTHDGRDSKILAGYSLTGHSHAEYALAGHSHGATGLSQADADARYLQLTGGNLSGNLSVSGSGIGYTTISQGIASRSGYVAFHAANGSRQGYIGWSPTTGGGDTGTIEHQAGTHAFYGNLTGSGSIDASSYITAHAGTASNRTRIGEIYGVAGMESGNAQMFHTGGISGWYFRNSGNIERAEIRGDGRAVFGYNYTSPNSNGAWSAATLEVRDFSRARIGFHQPGNTASSIGKENNSETIRTWNDPGTGYARFECAGCSVHGDLGVDNAIYSSLGMFDGVGYDGGYSFKGIRAIGASDWGFYCNGNQMVGRTGTPFLYNAGGDTYYNTLGGTAIRMMRTDRAVYASVFGGAYTNASSQSVKQNIRTLPRTERGLSQLTKLKPVVYQFIEEWQDQQGDKDRLGFLAEDVQSIYPEAVNEDSDGFLGIDYASLTVALVAGIQELLENVNAVKAETASLRAEMARNPR